MNTIDDTIIKHIVKSLILSGTACREEIIQGIDNRLLPRGFFSGVAAAKARNKDITMNWYKRECIEKRDVVLDTTLHHYGTLKALVDELAVGDESSLDCSITLKMGQVTVELGLNESLIVMNALAIKHATMREDAWSGAVGRTEKMLMQTLCVLYSVDAKYWDSTQAKANGVAEFEQEIDFFFVSNKARHKCEVKLMGIEKSERLDAAYLRKGDILVSDALSETDKKQLESSDTLWVSLKEKNGYQRFARVLEELNIPHQLPDIQSIEKRLDEILEGL